MYVEAVRHGSNHQFAGRVDDLRLKIVHTAKYFLDLKRRARNHPFVAVEIHAYLVPFLKPRLKSQGYAEFAPYVPQRFFRSRRGNAKRIVFEGRGCSALVVGSGLWPGRRAPPARDISIVGKNDLLGTFLGLVGVVNNAVFIDPAIRLGQYSTCGQQDRDKNK